MTELASLIDAALPQTQCTRCGYPDCRAYAEAIAAGAAPINRCPPGGAEGIRRLASVTGQPVSPLDSECGAEGPLRIARIDEARCIGCTLCIQACPVDAIVGSARRMHAVVEAQCTGCELCLPPCPVDCIELVVPAPERAGWAAIDPVLALQSRERHARRAARLERQERSTTAAAPAPQRSVLEAALARARAAAKRNSV